MINNNNQLSERYDKEIRKECIHYEKIAESCLKESFEDRFVCAIAINRFYECTDKFDKKFRKKYFPKNV